MVILPWDPGYQASGYVVHSIYTYVGKAEKLKTSGFGFGFGFFEKPEPEPNVGRHPYSWMREIHGRISVRIHCDDQSRMACKNQ